ncbi:hypothetical protein [uncultured Paludibaculum sp.]|uniref:hypothetical protein n=1 Tax=uncultured Paludibaculum sp. TaxID=1765020 RepID=UPI002AAAAA24|nr:hypothetical protein [uncultured Paludibaculum sp.]
MPRIVVCLFLLLTALDAQEPARVQPETERLESLIQELTAMKVQVAALESRIDLILRSLSEQKGALQSKPPAYNALRNIEADTAADAKPPAIRCAALTASGKRCTRAATDGSKYCKQHQLAHSK